MMNRKIFLIVLVSFLLFPNFISATLIQYSEYEVEKLSDMISEDCKYNSWFIICENVDIMGGLIKDNCITWEGTRIPVKLSSRGELQRYYNNSNELVGLEEITEAWEGNEYMLRIIDPSKEDVKEYLSAKNLGIIQGPPYIGKPSIICESKEDRSKYIALVADEYNQKFWDSKLIKEPRSFLSIGEFSFSIFGGISFISLFSLSLITLSIGGFIVYIIKKKKISFSKYIINVTKKTEDSSKGTENR